MLGPKWPECLTNSPSVILGPQWLVSEKVNIYRLFIPSLSASFSTLSGLLVSDKVNTYPLFILYINFRLCTAKTNVISGYRLDTYYIYQLLFLRSQDS